ncbi:MAG: FkbM family methyltransferase [Planctomycetes bacterium]|nr:FkbM family methyltransferase [Planctomycetota bacterium]
MKNYFEIGLNWMGRIKNYGLKNSIILFNNLHKKRLFSINFNKESFFLRGGTVDFDVFNSIMGKGAYNIKFDFEPENIVDAGANIGASTVYFKLAYPNSRIVAIEPEESNYQLLKKNLFPYSNIFLENAALWDNQTNVYITNPKAQKYAFRVGEEQGEGQGAVPGISMNTIIKKYGWEFIDILKMDVEGAEYQIFSGGSASWIKQVKAIIIELHDGIQPGSSNAFFNALKEIEFEAKVCGENIIIINRSI